MGWEGRLHRYPYPSVSRLAIYTDRHFVLLVKYLFAFKTDLASVFKDSLHGF